ncbi:hypothetical protein ACFQ5J_03070 [Lacticaseibacillus baoqingensis]|uniref:YfhD family protein n=1 Tax=Lacticaseibacillus baoqingensis TaxID=2486013 RepID=A0ABW4E6P8_9LACO|nr:hypothetical protein [Lacticaseibacillus baoqingensis]
MRLFKRKPEPESPEAGAYDFAKMVRDAREKDPSRFKRVQAAFKKRQQAPKPPKK